MQMYAIILFGCPRMRLSDRIARLTQLRLTRLRVMPMMSTRYQVDPTSSWLTYSSDGLQPIVSIWSIVGSFDSLKRSAVLTESYCF